ncbi:hypothetical protein ACQPYA_03775 [Micromonospora sp. CA-263727]|uniref:hypothetical protein n=1 Tax=Micromonospora sp. CA-263727 TaxID=3239967 RepID=UPI003D8C3BDA
MDPPGAHRSFGGPPAGDWAYDLDVFGDISYGNGPWPYLRDGKPAHVRLSPNTEYRAWNTEYVGVWPTCPGKARARMSLYVRQQSMTAVTVPTTVHFDLTDNTFIVDTRCPPQLHDQATAKARRILDLVAAARIDRETYTHPITARDRAIASGQADRGVTSTRTRTTRGHGPEN